MILDRVSEPVKHAADTVAVITPVAVFLDALPTVAALLSIVWLGLRIAIALVEYRTKNQEHTLNARKIAAQDEALKSFRDHLNQTTQEGIPPRFQRLLDQMK